MIEQTISIERIEDVIDIFGSFDENIKLIEHELDVSVVSRDDQLKISGEAENVLYAVKAVQGLLGLAEGDHHRAERPLHHQSGEGGQRGAHQRHRPGCALRHRQGQAHQAQDPGPETVCGRHQEEHHHPGHRPGGHRQDLPGHGHGHPGV